MRYESSIQRALDYIEGSLHEQVTLSGLAEKANFSPFHFHRVFQAVVGDTVMEYVRKRRLTTAAERLFYTEEKVVDIAFEVGFQYQESFNRAFKKFYGVTPVQYRAAKRLTGPLIGKASLATYHFSGGIRLEAKIIKKPVFHVIGYELKTTTVDAQNHKDIPKYWQQYIQNKLYLTIPEPLNMYQELGICTDFNPDTGEFVYIIGMEVKEGTQAPEGMVYRSFPETEFAVFTTPKSDDHTFTATIQSTWNHIFTEWFPNSGYEHSGTFEIELYDERCHGSENKEIDLYIPVKKQKVSVEN